MNIFSPRLLLLSLLPAFFLNGCVLKTGKRVRHEIPSLYSARSPEFRQSAGSLLGPNFVAGNNVVTLVNGEQIFPAMLSAIRSAKHSITFETYVFWDGEIGRQFTEALAERARAGVKVHAILDAQCFLRGSDCEQIHQIEIRIARRTSDRLSEIRPGGFERRKIICAMQYLAAGLEPVGHERGLKLRDHRSVHFVMIVAPVFW